MTDFFKDAELITEVLNKMWTMSHADDVTEAKQALKRMATKYILLEGRGVGR